MSVADRDYKTDEGEIRTMPGIRNLVRYQQQLAADEGSGLKENSEGYFACSLI